MTENQNERRRVLIAMDGSQYSDYAFEWYISHTRHPNDHVTVVTCFENHGCTAYFQRNVGSDDFRKQIQEDLDIHSELESRLHLKLKNAGILGTVYSCFGKAGEAIVQAARENKSEMIICGTRGHGKLRRTIMGSVSSYIIHHSDVPVIVCRHKDHHQHHHHHHGHAHPVIIDSPVDVSKLVHRK